MPRSWKLLKHTAPAPKPGRLLTPVRKHKILLINVHVQKKRGSYWSCLSLLLLYLYSVTQCLSLTLVFWTDLSNSIFSFCLSLLHSSLFGIALVYFEFLLFPSISHAALWFSPCILICSTIPSCISHWFLWLTICCVLHTLPPPFAPSLLSFARHSLPLHLLRHRQTWPAPTSLAGHWPDAQPRAGRRGPVLCGLARPP